jgi:hypothetical protein
VLHLLANDNKVDHADCGPGTDVLWRNSKEPEDIAVNCEIIKTVTVTRADDD